MDPNDSFEINLERNFVNYVKSCLDFILEDNDPFMMDEDSASTATTASNQTSARVSLLRVEIENETFQGNF